MLSLKHNTSIWDTITTAKNPVLKNLGIEKSIARARECIYWSGLTSQIKDTISKYQICIHHRNESSETTIPHKICETPWTLVEMDTFHLCNRSFLIIIDYTNKMLIYNKFQNWNPTQSFNVPKHHLQISSEYLQNGVLNM